MTVEETLFELFGEFNTIHELDEHGYACYSTDDFIICIDEHHGFHIVSVDLKKVFNKTSQSPIHFQLSEYKPLSKRKKNRIREATRYLLTNRKIAGGFFGCMDGFDDLSSSNRLAFYNFKN
jgi:hypothetical protein